MTESPTETLRRWEDHGASWRLLELRHEHAVVELRTCHGEPVDRLESSDPELLGLLRRRASSEDPVGMAPLAPLRLADAADAPRLAELMRTSVLELFPRVYDARQTASAAVHVAHLDAALIADGTYFVAEVGDELVACGGWSRRGKLYSGSGDHQDDARLLDPRSEPARVRAMFVRGDWTRRGLGRTILASCERAARTEGFRDLALMATLPGEPLYRACGFRVVERTVVTMPDGVRIEGVAMERPIDASG